MVENRTERTPPTEHWRAGRSTAPLLAQEVDPVDGEPEALALPQTHARGKHD